MARDSANVRKHRRTKRKASIALRTIKQMNVRLFNCQSTLLMMLAQVGGEMTVTTGTMQQVLAQLQNLEWSLEMKPELPNEFTVRMVNTGAAHEVVTEDAQPVEVEADASTVVEESAAEVERATLPFYEEDGSVIEYARNTTGLIDGQ